MCLNDIYVVFTKAKSTKGVFRFLNKNISHCYVLIDVDGKWLALNPKINNFEIFTIQDMNDIIDNSIIVKVKRVETSNLFRLGTCTSFVKNYIGLNGWFVFTPYQLYKRIK